MLWRLWTIGLCACALLSLAGSARAQSDEAKDQARRLFNRGIEQYEAGRYDNALQSFEKAYRLSPHPLVRVNIANCYDRLGQSSEALGHFEAFMRETEGDQSRAEQRAEVQLEITRLRGAGDQPPPPTTTTDPTSPPAEDASTQVAITTEASSSDRIFTTPVIVAGAVSGACLIGAVAFWIASANANADFEDLAARSNNVGLPPGDRMAAHAAAVAAADRADGRALAADILLAGAVVAGATAAVFIFTREDAENTPTVALRVGPMGASVDGTF